VLGWREKKWPETGREPSNFILFGSKFWRREIRQLESHLSYSIPPMLGEEAGDGKGTI